MPRIGVSDFLASAGLADHPDHSLNASSCYSSHSQLPAALGPFAAAASPIFTASTFVQPKSSAPVVHSSFTSSHHEMEVLDHSKRSLSTRKPPPPAKKLAHQGTAMAKPAASTDFGLVDSATDAASGAASSAAGAAGSATGSSGGSATGSSGGSASGGSGGHNNCEKVKDTICANTHGKVYDPSKAKAHPPTVAKCCKAA